MYQHLSLLASPFFFSQLLNTIEQLQAVSSTLRRGPNTHHLRHTAAEPTLTHRTNFNQSPSLRLSPILATSQLTSPEEEEGEEELDETPSTLTDERGSGNKNDENGRAGESGSSIMGDTERPHGKASADETDLFQRSRMGVLVSPLMRSEGAATSQSLSHGARESTVSAAQLPNSQLWMAQSSPPLSDSTHMPHPLKRSQQDATTSAPSPSKKGSSGRLGAHVRFAKDHHQEKRLHLGAHRANQTCVLRGSFASSNYGYPPLVIFPSSYHSSTETPMQGIGA